MLRPAITILIAVISLVALTVVSSCVYIVAPGERGVLVTLGKADLNYKSEGLGFKMPMISELIKIPVKQQSAELVAPCFSSDLQSLNIKLRLIYRFPEESVVKIYTEFQTNILLGIVVPKAQEAIKEVTATRNAEQIVKQRESVKAQALLGLRQKLQSLVIIEDLVLENIDLSDELEKAIESKMVQEQSAGKSKFAQEQARIEAETARIRAQGEADAIKIRSQSLEQNPRIIQLMIAEKWNGVSPLVVGSGDGSTGIILPIDTHKNSAR